MNLWDQNVTYQIEFFDTLETRTIFEDYNQPHKLLAEYLIDHTPETPNAAVSVECYGANGFYKYWLLESQPKMGITYHNLECEVLAVTYDGDVEVTYHAFYTSPASGTLMISDDIHTALIENKMNLGDIFVIGFLTIFLSILIFKTIWNFVFPKITKGKSINDL